MGSRTKRILTRALLHATVAVVVGVLFFPVYWMFNTSLAPQDQLYVYPPRMIHPSATLAAYVKIFSERPIARWMANSFFVVVLTGVFALTISVLAGYSLSRFRVRGSGSLGYLLLASRMLPTTLLVIPLFVFMSSLKLINTLWSVVIANVTFIMPFATWMLKGYFDSIPRELEEAAYIDGTSRLGALIKVTMPLAAPGVAATTLYSAILAWDEYLFARTFLTTNSVWTISVGLGSFRGEYITFWNEVMAASLVGTLPIIVIFLLLEKQLVGGLTAGAVK
ncbi:MAG: carbohydrate ABC transporter permease [Armatimonadota bacterium]|nr:carbohydrate ABC transporter permease [Armatimonadota bacterium]